MHSVDSGDFCPMQPTKISHHYKKSLSTCVRTENLDSISGRTIIKKVAKEGE